MEERRYIGYIILIVTGILLCIDLYKGFLKKRRNLNLLNKMTKLEKNEPTNKKG